MRYVIALMWPPLAAVISAPTRHVVLNACLWFAALFTVAVYLPLAFLLWLASLFHAMALVQVFYQRRREQDLVQIAEATRAGVIAAFQAGQPPDPATPAQPSNYDAERNVYKL